MRSDLPDHLVTGRQKIYILLIYAKDPNTRNLRVFQKLTFITCSSLHLCHPGIKCPAAVEDPD